MTKETEYVLNTVCVIKNIAFSYLRIYVLKKNKKCKIAIYGYLE